jgi:hypothetical protein
VAAEDPRVKAVPTLALQDGWNGKQFGCQQAGNFATGTWLLFTDADVRFSPDAIARTLAAAAASKGRTRRPSGAGSRTSPVVTTATRKAGCWERSLGT